MSTSVIGCVSLLPLDSVTTQMSRDKELSSDEGEFRALPKYGSVQSSSEMSKRPGGGSNVAEVVQCRG